MPHPRRLLPLAVLLPTLLALPASPTLSHDGPLGHSHESPMARAGREMAEAATNLWTSLSPEQQRTLQVEFGDPLRHDWHFVPRTRKGLSFREMSPEQDALAHALLASGLSQRGFIKAETIMSLESILKIKEGGKGPVRDPEQYFFNLFGTPGSTDPKKPWGWRIEGHHLSLNFTIVGDQGVAGGPSFLGSNPAEVTDGPRKGLRILGEEEDLGRKLVKALDADQRKRAVFLAQAPRDIVTMNRRVAKPLDPVGIAMGELNPEQKEMLNALIVAYAERLRPEIAADDLSKIMKAGVDNVRFGWAGGLERGEPHYYRVQGPTFLLEYDNTQGNANHVHSVWRDFDGDFGEDLLRKHYESAGSEHGHGPAR